MDSITETLIFPYKKGFIERPGPDSRLLFLNAENPILLKNFVSSVLIQPRFDRAEPLIRAGYKITPSESDEKFNTVWILPGKGMEETQYLLAQAIRAAADGGLIIAAAPNDAGGKRLEGLFEELGLSTQAKSKHKARVVFATVDDGWNRELAESWLAQGQEQHILSSDLISRPGLHGWDKVDAGSALLARHLPADLSGSIADFGCGWGYLSLQALSPLPAIAGEGGTQPQGWEGEGLSRIEFNPRQSLSPALSRRERGLGITRLTLVDIDSRAVDIARRNVLNHHPELPVDTVWTDLTHPEAALGPFDAILLNPPFHAGTHALPALGQVIIATAARSLKPGGRLYLVANRHLPYESTLEALFERVEVLGDEDGFKAFVCSKKLN